MRIKGVLRVLRKIDHIIHGITQLLIIIAVISEFLSRLFSASASTLVTASLHAVHFTSLGILLTYAVTKVLFGKSPGTLLSRAIAFSRRSEHTILLGLRDIFFVVHQYSIAAAILEKLNIDAYEGTEFEMTPEEIKRRNSRIISKNHDCFMLILDPASPTDIEDAATFREKTVAYTAVFPLNQVGADIYTQGIFHDRAFPCEFICGNQEAAAVLLVFGWGLSRKARSDKQKTSHYLELLYRGIQTHISHLTQKYASDKETVDVWIVLTEKEHKELEDLGFRSTPWISGDGFPIFCRTYPGGMHHVTDA